MLHCFIINPAAGKGAAPQLIEALRAACRERGEDCLIRVTAAPGDAAALARELCRQHPGEPLRLYACGGDGTAGEVAGGIRSCPGSDAALGVIPCGSGNDLIKCFPGRDFTDIPGQLAGETLPIDLIDFCGRTAVNLCNCGIDADVAHNMPLFRRLPGVSGALAYRLSILYTFFRPLGKGAEVILDGQEPLRHQLLLLVCANGQYYGGGFRGAPLAEPDDGLLDVCLVPKLSRPRVLAIIGKYQKGLHLSDPAVRPLVIYRRARRLEARFDGEVTMCMDGETFRSDRMTARVLPRAVRLILPAGRG